MGVLDVNSRSSAMDDNAAVARLADAVREQTEAIEAGTIMVDADETTLAASSSLAALAARRDWTSALSSSFSALAAWAFAFLAARLVFLAFCLADHHCSRGRFGFDWSLGH